MTFDEWWNLPNSAEGADTPTEFAQAAWYAALESQHTKRWNIEPDGDDLLICDGNHDKHDKCDYIRYSPKAAPSQEPVAWMIECRNEFTGWWDGKSRLDCRFFEKDPNKGKRFVNKDAAELLIATQGNSCMIATDHLWCDLAPSKEPSEDCKNGGKCGVGGYCEDCHWPVALSQEPDFWIDQWYLDNSNHQPVVTRTQLAPTQHPLYFTTPDAAAQIAEQRGDLEVQDELIKKQGKQIAELTGALFEQREQITNLQRLLDDEVKLSDKQSGFISELQAQIAKLEAQNAMHTQGREQ